MTADAFNLISDKEFQSIRKSLANPADVAEITATFGKIASLPPQAQDYVISDLEAGFTKGVKLLKKALPVINYVLAMEAGEPALAQEVAAEPEIRDMMRQFLLETHVAAQLMEFKKGDVSPEIKLYAEKLSHYTTEELSNPFTGLRAMAAVAAAGDPQPAVGVSNAFHRPGAGA
ncbi:MAG: hypothetical protein EPN97_18890 [Alphaproteobacteria bacterium]|nr:MAG: hypothetical protein EPN97_18890 [Alphaproteobacteria bacterium]